MVDDKWIECRECLCTYDSDAYADCPVCAERAKMNNLIVACNKRISEFRQEFQTEHWDMMRRGQESESGQVT